LGRLYSSGNFKRGRLEIITRTGAAEGPLICMAGTQGQVKSGGTSRDDNGRGRKLPK